MVKIFILLVMVVAVAMAKKVSLDLVPGKSLGEVTLGDSRTDLLAKGFTADPDRASLEFTYLLKQPLLVLLKDDKVFEICLLDFPKHLKVLRYRGKDFPRSAQLETVSDFIGACEEQVVGSGGVIRRCGKGGVELATRYPSSTVESLCVKNPRS